MICISMFSRWLMCRNQKWWCWVTVAWTVSSRHKVTTSVTAWACGWTTHTGGPLVSLLVNCISQRNAPKMPHSEQGTLCCMPSIVSLLYLWLGVALWALQHLFHTWLVLLSQFWFPPCQAPSYVAIVSPFLVPALWVSRWLLIVSLALLLFWDSIV